MTKHKTEKRQGSTNEAVKDRPIHPPKRLNRCR